MGGTLRGIIYNWRSLPHQQTSLSLFPNNKASRANDRQYKNCEDMLKHLEKWQGCGWVDYLKRLKSHTTHSCLFAAVDKLNIWSFFYLWSSAALLLRVSLKTWPYMTHNRRKMRNHTTLSSPLLASPCCPSFQPPTHSPNTPGNSRGSVL